MAEHRQPTPQPPIEPEADISQEISDEVGALLDAAEQNPLPISEEEVGIPTAAEIARETVEFAQVAVPVTQPEDQKDFCSFIRRCISARCPERTSYR